MTIYATEASILRGAARRRIRDLTVLLSEYGCVSRIDWQRQVIVFELPDDDVAWILTGGFAEVLAGFEDCLRWRAAFRERSRPAASLPPPASQAAGHHPSVISR